MGKGKTAIVCILCVLIAAIIAFAAVFCQVPLSYDKEKITPIASNVRLLSASDPLNKSGSPALAKIEKAIIASNLGITPLNDGKIIRLPIPPLSGERRQQLSKQVKARCEEGDDDYSTWFTSVSTPAASTT